MICLKRDFKVFSFNSSAESFYQWKTKNILVKNFLSLCDVKGYKCPIPHNFFDNPSYMEIIQDLRNGHDQLCTVNWFIYPLKLTEHVIDSVILVGKNTTLKKNNITYYLDQVVACTPGSLYWKDRNGHYLGCNEFMVKTAGLNSINAIIGKTDYELWPESAKQIIKNDHTVIETGKTMFIEETIRIPDGTLMQFTGVKMPLRDEHENIVGVIGNSLDITKLKQPEFALREAKEKVEIANKVKLEFMRNMEHDIRTPFNGIWGIANIMWQRETDQEKKELLSDITSCAKELLDYCDGILDFSKIEEGALPLVTKKFDIKKLVESIMAIEKPPAKYKQLDFTLHYCESIPDVLIGDEYRLRRILLNLISNAIKFTQEGHVKLSVDLAKRDKREIILKFIVSDTGIGIPQDKQAYLYERFSKIIESNKGLYKGIGVGLRIVKQFIDEMDSEIDVKSTVNVGTTFTCTIPLKLPLLDEPLETPIVFIGASVYGF